MVNTIKKKEVKILTRIGFDSNEIIFFIILISTKYKWILKKQFFNILKFWKNNFFYFLKF